jgi:hypothetical protein
LVAFLKLFSAFKYACQISATVLVFLGERTFQKVDILFGFVFFLLPADADGACDGIQLLIGNVAQAFPIDSPVKGT